MELIVGNKYNLKFNVNFCHIASVGQVEIKKEDLHDINPFIFVGTIPAKYGRRNIFYNIESNSSTYVMFSDDNVESYATPYRIPITIKDIADKFGVSVDDIEVVD